MSPLDTLRRFVASDPVAFAEANWGRTVLLADGRLAVAGTPARVAEAQRRVREVLAEPEAQAVA